MSGMEQSGSNLINRMSSDAQKEIIVQVLRKAFDPYAIILFGSAAKGTLCKDSDLDLAYI